ncbi:MAG: CBS domain-containing protein [Paracoccaceae bacterium]|jgi:CBS domain-containing protein|nr:CBS domain-containing protein [Paracoccaceae bacterium]MDP7185781.1 CBS domain-containing protein [Paracoccaceae bacterium]
MLVQQILKSKPSTGTITVKPETKISEVAALLTEHRIGGVVVSSDGVSPDGILSERDIVRAAARQGAGCFDEPAESIMTKDPKTCSGDETADEILQRMTEGRFRHMPVVEGGKMIGIVTIGDLVAARLSELSMEKSALEGMIMGH